jgi:hypothetical protein
MIAVTFDSNVWRPIVSPARFPNEPLLPVFQAIRAAIQGGRVKPFLAETVFTLEAVPKKNRRQFFGSYRLEVNSSSETTKDGRINVKMTLSPPKGLHARNDPVRAAHLTDAVSLGFRLLRIPRIGGLQNPDLQPDWFASGRLEGFDERLARTSACLAAIEAKGCGMAQIRELGLRYATKGAHWRDGVGNIPADQEPSFTAAVAEWADGDSVAGHYGYGNDYFCTLDAGISGGAASVLHSSRRAWLDEDFGIRVVTPVQLAEVLR